MSKSVMLLGLMGLIIGALIIESFRKEEFYEGQIITLPDGAVVTLLDDKGYDIWAVSQKNPKGDGEREFESEMDEDEIRLAMSGKSIPTNILDADGQPVNTAREPVEAPRG